MQWSNRLHAQPRLYCKLPASQGHIPMIKCSRLRHKIMLAFSMTSRSLFVGHQHSMNVLTVPCRQTTMKIDLDGTVPRECCSCLLPLCQLQPERAALKDCFHRAPFRVHDSVCHSAGCPPEFLGNRTDQAAAGAWKQLSGEIYCLHGRAINVCSVCDVTLHQAFCLQEPSLVKG